MRHLLRWLLLLKLVQNVNILSHYQCRRMSLINLQPLIILDYIDRGRLIIILYLLLCNLFDDPPSRLFLGLDRHFQERLLNILRGVVNNDGI